MYSDKKAYIFGAGISGCSMARKLADAGWEVCVYEKHPFIGGNCCDSINQDGVLFHNFGPHIFHTSNEEVYEFISRFTTLNKFENQVLASINNKLVPLPINFDSIKLINSSDADEIIEKLVNSFPNSSTVSFFDLQKIEDKKINALANWIFKNIYANYSSKMWGLKFEEIPIETINRVKICLSHNRSYFPEDKYQGLPINGYTKMLEKMLDHPNITVHLQALQTLHIKDNKTYIDNQLCDGLVFYCGSIDELLGYQYGTLPYRSLDIQFESLALDSYQDTAVVNYPAHPSMTRITEYKKMTFQDIPNKTVISKEYPGEFDFKSIRFNKRFYPIKNQANEDLYNKYLVDLSNISNLCLLGRLAEYKYYDMDEAIEAVLSKIKALHLA